MEAERAVGKVAEGLEADRAMEGLGEVRWEGICSIEIHLERDFFAPRAAAAPPPSASPGASK